MSDSVRWQEVIEAEDQRNTTPATAIAGDK
jgi:hypothetical protein